MGHGELAACPGSDVLLPLQHWAAIQRISTVAICVQTFRYFSKRCERLGLPSFRFPNYHPGANARGFKGSFITSLGAAINFANHAIGIPILSSLLLKNSRDPHERLKDDIIAQISGLFLVLGTGIAFTADSWAPFVIGQVMTGTDLAFRVPARSIVASMVTQEHLAALFTAVSVLLYGRTASRQRV